MIKKLNKRLIILIAIILVIVIIGIIISANVIETNIKNSRYNSANNNSSSGNLLPEYIKEGITLGGITGTLVDLDTYDATATEKDIVWGKTAYVKGEKLTGIWVGVPIPDGFYYVGGTKEEGVVISDDPSDENKYKDQINVPKDGLNGNQFVWVPVEDDYVFKTYCGYNNGVYDEEFSLNTSEPSTVAASWEINEYNTMKSSVEKNNGFYVARFEASEGSNGKVESKQGVNPINYVAWGDSMTDIGIDGAVAKSQNMYNDSEHAVTSTLIYGAQWDAIMNWLDPKYSTATKDDPCSSDSIVVDSSGHGNQNTGTKLEICGSSESDKLKNIYDLCGNVGEWTMEADFTDCRVGRGGSLYSSGYVVPVSHRGYFHPDNDTLIDIGFRVALYL